MISVCYLIVCVNLLYSLDKAKTLSPTKTWKVKRLEQALFFKSLTAENQYEYLANKVSPYWNLTYHEQLDKKQNHCSAIVDMLGKRAERWKNSMICKLLQIVPSPVTKAYRNKDEFVIWRGVDRNAKTVGFAIGKHSLVSVHPTKIITIKESHKRVAQVYEDFIRLSPVPASHKIDDCGHWRTLLVRSNEAGDVMASVTVQPIGYSIKTIQEQQQELKVYFFKHLPNITLFQQQCPYIRCAHNVAPFIRLYGKPYLIETLNGYKFKISPDTSFQINKLGAEVFYDTIIKTAKLTPNTTVLDIYSGTGTIIIMMSKFVGKTVGIESDLKAITDAKYSAYFNNIHNVNFLLGRAEKKLKSVLRKLRASSDIVAIINAGPVRIGYNVVRTIRRTPQISRLLYISCKPENQYAVQNFVVLCSNKSSKFPPFKLTKAIPVDLFPQTARVELILVFQRSPHR